MIVVGYMPGLDPKTHGQFMTAPAKHIQAIYRAERASRERKQEVPASFSVQLFGQTADDFLA